MDSQILQPRIYLKPEFQYSLTVQSSLSQLVRLLKDRFSRDLAHILLFELSED